MGLLKRAISEFEELYNTEYNDETVHLTAAHVFGLCINCGEPLKNTIHGLCTKCTTWANTP